MKVFGFIIVLVWLFIVLISSGDQDFWNDMFISITKVFFYLFLLFMVLTVVAYLFYAMIQGGKYCVVFEMDEKGISHTQTEKQYDKAKVLALIAMVSGLVTNNHGAFSVGMVAGSRNSIYSKFKSVVSIVAYPRRGVILVNQPAIKNQIYVDGEDFDFVLGYIRDHCPKATVKIKGHHRS